MRALVVLLVFTLAFPLDAVRAYGATPHPSAPGPARQQAGSAAGAQQPPPVKPPEKQADKQADKKPTEKKEGNKQPDPNTPAVPPEQLGVDVDRIKQELAQQSPTLKLDATEPEQGTHFRVRVYEYSYKPPTLADDLKIPWAPAPAGGIYHDELMKMMTPEGYRGSAPFTNREMVQLALTSFLAALGIQAAVAGYNRSRELIKLWEQQQAREQVQRDLEAFKKQQADGQVKSTDGRQDPNKDPKKQDPKKDPKKEDPIIKK